MGACDVNVRDARLQVGDAPVILANGQRFTMFFNVIHTIGTHCDYTN